MAIDRDEVLRKAEKLLRQGRLDGAIAEYERVVQAHPDDLTTAAALGDLYGRAGQAAKAVSQYLRIGDHFLDDGVPAKAAASYRKVLKLDAQHEGALLQLAEACARQGQLADAKTHLRTATERRLARGDRDGADALVIRLSELDPADFEARLAAAQIGVRTGKAKPDDLLRLAGELDERGRTLEAESLLEEVVKRDPAATTVRLRLARAALERGELERARTFLPRTEGSTDPDLLVTAAKLYLADGHLDDARSHLARFLAAAPQSQGVVSELAERQTSQAARYAIVDLLVDQAAGAGDYKDAARRLQAFLKSTPRHVPALLRLVEICVDGELESDLTSAQEELAEAYLQTDEADKARVIAEDLLLRQPRSPAHRDRLRRILVSQGETDPDAVIADRVAFWGDEGLLGTEAAASGEDAGESVGHSAGDAAEASADTAQAPADEGVEFEPVEFEAWQAPEAELSADQDGLAPAEASGAAAPDANGGPSDEPSDGEESPAGTPGSADGAAEGEAQLNNVFAGLRGKAQQEAASLPPGDHAARNFRVGQTYAAAGMVREAAEAFENAARDPRYRFRSAQALGRLYRKQGMVKEAVQWLDIASEAPAPKIDEHRAALYELADALEASGETTRALVVLLDLVAEQDDYRDARARIDRLSRVQA